MGKKVLHFVRKYTQLQTSFIKNQISNHVNVEPMIVFRKNDSMINDKGFTDFNLKEYKFLNLGDNESIIEKVKFKTFKTLSKGQLLLIEDFIKKNDIDICHFHYGTDCGTFYPFLKRLKIPSVVSFYGYDCSSFPRFFMGYGKQYLSNRVFKSITAVFAMSPDMKQDLINAGCPKEKIIVHYYGTDCKFFYAEHNYTPTHKIILLILATLVPQKGHMFLFESIKQLVKKGIKLFELKVIGSGELEEHLKQYIKKNNLSEYVRFLGPIKYASSEMLFAYQDADIFVHPSVIAQNGDKEGIPGTVIEAMASGLPVISTYHAGIPHIIENGETGLLVKEWDVNGLASAIERLITDPKLRIQFGKAGQNYAIHKLDIEKKELALEEIYNKLIANS